MTEHPPPAPANAALGARADSRLPVERRSAARAPVSIAFWYRVFYGAGLALTIGGALSLLASSAFGQTSRSGGDSVSVEWPIDPATAPRPVAYATETTASITVDGRLSEPEWLAVEPIRQFIQRDPALGYPPTERTEVRFLYDSENLYIGAVLYDRNMAGVIFAGLRRDGDPMAGDRFGVALDTFLDRRNSYYFGTNPGGALTTSQSFNDGRIVNRAWEGVARVATQVTDSAWIVEMAIPFTTLRFDPSRVADGWGVQILRRIRRKNEWLYWAPLERGFNSYSLSKAGTLLGLSEIRPGRNLSVKPYVVGTVAAEQAGPGGLRTTRDATVGIDLRYGLTPCIVADLSYRTDFAQVEVDQQQVNLTRFPLFFPEQREFFLDNAGIFAFGDTRQGSRRSSTAVQNFALFHSRRIGLLAGQPIPILGGGRLTGRLDRYDFGIVNMQTESTAEVPAENFTALRLKRNVFEASEIGVMLLNRQATGTLADGAYNRSLGADASLRLFRSRLIIESYLAATDRSGLGSDGTTSRVSIGWRDRRWDVSGMVRRVGEHFDPGMGFIARTASRQFYGTVGRHFYPGVFQLLAVNTYVEVDYLTDLRSVLETRIATVGTTLDFRDSGSLTLSVQDAFERLKTPFHVAPDVTIVPGDYDAREGQVEYRLGLGRPMTGNVRFARGGFFGGKRSALGVGATWWARHNLDLGLFLDQNRVSLPQHSFNASVAGARLQYDHTPNLSASAFVQYNAQTGDLISSLRFNLRYAPLSDVHLVYSEQRHPSTSAVLDRLLAVKVTRLYTF